MHTALDGHQGMDNNDVLGPASVQAIKFQVCFMFPQNPSLSPAFLCHARHFVPFVSAGKNDLAGLKKKTCEV